MPYSRIPSQKIESAANGDRTALRDVLRAAAAAVDVQQTVTNTTPKRVPPQCRSAVALLASTYVVEILNPGQRSATTLLQRAQAAGSQTAATNVQNQTPIFHQVQAATSPLFSAAASLQQFGGDAGSTQTYYAITTLGSGQWYFRIRSSYDGKNWNAWRTANGGRGLNGRAVDVVAESVTNGVGASMIFPGNELVAFVSAVCPSGAGFTLPEHLYTSAMAAIASPNGGIGGGTDSHGWDCELDIAAPAGGSAGLTGPADYPVELQCQYQDGNQNIWLGSSNAFAFAYNPLGANVAQVSVTNGGWAVFTLPGGAKLAVGAGVVNNGGAIPMPAGFSASNMVAIPSALAGYSAGNHAHGVVCTVTGGVCTSYFQDGQGDQWDATCQWFAVAWSPGLTVQTTGSGRWLIVSLIGGGKLAIGAGSVATGTVVTLPAGFTVDNSLTFAAPASYNDAGYPMRGVARCSLDVVGASYVATLQYTDAADNIWGGNLSWFAVAWQ